ncbi:hypothetical protein O3M35_010056 [Rhynocoris fuscipes]|uniref:Uncharacterized protein n=1 Tax=Rhynocoris fuscipes TaxID=488301 RepID=A0AAW1D0D3_9HEMI
MILKNIKRLKNCLYFYKYYFSKIDRGLLSCIIACLAPVLIPPAHIATLYYFWHQFSRRVDRRYCSCSCWDTVFKGTYESGIASYKHVYFNASFNTLKIWALTVICVIIFYESIRRLILLGLQSYLRYSMLLLFLSAIFSHYYSWWSYVNYWNDDYYVQWNHQLFFTCTELMSTFLVLQLADNRLIVTPRKALGIVGVAIMHVIAGSLDQFVMNVVKGEGHMHQVLRDLSFMVPDLLHVVLPLVELKRSYCKLPKYSHVPMTELRRDIFIIITLISLGIFLCSLL